MSDSLLETTEYKKSLLIWRLRRDLNAFKEICLKFDRQGVFAGFAANSCKANHYKNFAKPPALPPLNLFRQPCPPYKSDTAISPNNVFVHAKQT